MSLYETVFIARQDLSATQVENLTEHFKKAIADHGGSILKTEYWGLRRLAYEIKKNSRGHYTLLHIDAPKEAVQEMERQMYINEDLMRYLTIKEKKLDPEPTAILRHAKSRFREGDEVASERGESSELS